MNYLSQYLFSGLMVGSIYSLLALGFVLIYKSSHIFNFAQGELLLIGAYVGWMFSTLFHLPIWIVFLLTMGTGYVVGILTERLCMRPMIGQSHLATIMMTIGLAYFFSGTIMAAFGRYPSGGFPQWLPSEAISLGSVAISIEQGCTFLISVAAVIILVAFFQRTKAGLGMRAAAEDVETAQSLGVRATKMFAYSWAIAAVTAGIAGIMLGTLVGVRFTLGAVGLKVFPVVILGGLDSVQGAIVAGVVIGMLEYLAIGYLDPIVGAGFGSLFPFVIAILIMLVKPYGLFGLVRIERV